MSNDKTLPPWPDIPELIYADCLFHPAAQEKLSYERALAAAWEARCRLAVKALRDIDKGALSDTDMFACEAIEAIGPLPEETK